MIEALRTPQERFTGLPGWDYEPRYVTLPGSGLRMHMQDEVLGPPSMQALRRVVRGCPEPYEIEEAGHFVQEWGEHVARRSLGAFAG